MLGHMLYLAIYKAVEGEYGMEVLDAYDCHLCFHRVSSASSDDGDGRSSP